MHSAVENMIATYQCRTTDDYRNALKEIVQEVALLGLSRSGFFNAAAFYGGTALRIFYGMDRFSEDLDFSLVNPNLDFNLSSYTQAVQDELGSFGFEMTVAEKIKHNDSPVKSAFIKGGTQIHLLKITSISPPVSGVHPNEQLTVKLEVDSDPPGSAGYEVKYQLNPVPYSVRLYAPSSLFAGKIHAILCRNWRTRAKGRDFYDYIWFLAREIPLNLDHLRQRMIQSGHLDTGKLLRADDLQRRLAERFAAADFEQLIKDVRPFIKDQHSLALWSPEFFTSITQDKLKIE
jgi:predicted nucleotidyltransferase component of viral defense system